VPSHVDAGFRDLALYLQAAARHVEHLCEDIAQLAAERKKPIRKRRKKLADASAIPEEATPTRGATSIRATSNNRTAPPSAGFL
jgi:hypothetical protein